MIHLLEVSPDMLPAQLSKLARRYAMTGGYEVALKEDLDRQALNKLVEIYLPVLKSFPASSLQFKTNTAYRILSLVAKSDKIDQDLRYILEKELHPHPFD